MAVDAKTLNGLAFASVKTRNGLAVADIKSINGVDTTAGGFSPPDIAGLEIWLDAREIVASDNDPVSSWPDTSGNANDATSAGGSFDDPTFKTNILNTTLPVVRFDGVLNALQHPYNGSVNKTIFVVTIPRTSSLNSYSGLYMDLATRTYGRTAGEASWGSFAGADFGSGTTLVEDTPYILCLSYDGATLRTYTNGVAGNTVGADCTANGTNSIGADLFSTNRCYQGDHFMVLAYDSNLSDANKNLVGNYIEGITGITWTNI